MTEEHFLVFQLRPTLLCKENWGGFSNTKDSFGKLVIKVKDPCLQRLTLGKVVMGQQDPNQGHEMETEAPEHGQRGSTEMITYREKKSKLRKIPWLTPQLHFIHPFLSTTWEF